MKTDDILLELNRTAAKHMRQIQPFKYKEKKYRLINNYTSTPAMKCDICGDYPEFEISIIQPDNGPTLHAGNDCIDFLTGQNVSEWMKNFRKKRENIMANRKRIDQLTTILETYNKKDAPAQITDEDAKKIRTILEQIEKGVNLTVKQQEIADTYLVIKVKA